jgi:quinohemoprotein ethanol dehydrogenase
MPSRTGGLPACAAAMAAAVLLTGGCSKSQPLPPAGTARPTPLAGQVDQARLDAADNEPGQWLASGRDGAGTYHSRLHTINQANASGLGFAWEYRLGTNRGLEATPLVIDGVMYTSGNFGRVYALDAATGAERWVYDPTDGQAGRYACCDAVNRGVAVWKGRVYVGALDGYLHAIDAATGKRIWKVDAVPARGPKSPYTLSGAPTIAGNLVIIGPGGGDFHGVRGYVAAFDADTGALRWRFYTVPRDPSMGAQDQSHLVDAVKTWDPRHRWETGGGGTVWDGISYDPSLHLIYVGTGNAAPYNIKEGGRTGGDNLYTASILALRERTGELAWHYQVVPGDMWDYDSTQKMVLADMTLEGRPRKVLLQASKNGFFYVLDRVTGELISAKPYVHVNWTRGIDPRTGRPLAAADIDYTNTPRVIYPFEGGAHNWQPMSFDPAAAIAYIPAMEVGDIQVETSNRPAGLVEGQFTSPILPTEDYQPKALAPLLGAMPPAKQLFGKSGPLASRAFLRAWNVTTQSLSWEVATQSYWNGGVLSTDGGIVVQGDVAGHLNVYDATHGKLLTSVNLGSSVMAAPMTYSVGVDQFIAVMAGYGGGQIGAPFPQSSAAYRYGNAGRIIALKLGGGSVPIPREVRPVPFPQPPARSGTPAQIEAGAILFNRFCSRCHAFGPAVLPDLRKLSPEKHRIFSDIVLNGALSPLGMGRFDDVLTRADAEALHAYLIDEAWSAFQAGRAGHPDLAHRAAGTGNDGSAR